MTKKSPDFTAAIRDIVNACDVLATTDKLQTTSDIENVLNSIMSLVMISVAREKSADVIKEFCAKLSSPSAFTGTGPNSRADVAIRVLSSLFNALETHHNVKSQYVVYDALVDLCARSGQIHELPTELTQLNTWMNLWKISLIDRQQLLRKLCTVLRAAGHTQATAQVMLALLDTYSMEAGAPPVDAVNDAHATVCTAISDPNVFIMDHLLRLKPVQVLQQKDPALWGLLQICVSGGMNEFTAFKKQHPTFAKDTLKMDEAQLLKKIRMLTLIGRCEPVHELTYDDLRSMLHIDTDDAVEDFVIDAIQAEAVKGKLDGARRTFLITGCVYRQFDKEQWTALRAHLDQWHIALGKALNQLSTLNSVELAG